MSGNYILWDNDSFLIATPLNPHLPYSEGLHLMITSKQAIANAWEDPQLAGEAFRLAAEACKIMKNLKLSPWFNVQANGNWGLLPGRTPFFHIHIYGRNKTASWGKPLVLPLAPQAYKNDPMPEADRTMLAKVFKSQL